MLDCAHGYQKEDQKESDEVEETRRQKGDAQAKTGEEEETFSEVGGEKTCSKKSDSQKEDYRQEESWREDRGRGQEKDRAEKTRCGLCGILQSHRDRVRASNREICRVYPAARERVGSESVDELMGEGNAFEAEVVQGVEDTGDDEGREVRTHEVPQDDVPEEYLDRDKD